MNRIAIHPLDETNVETGSRLLANYANGTERYAEQCRSSLLILQRLIQSGYAYGLIATLNDVTAGLLTYNWGFSTSKGLPILRIQDVFTAPDARKNGVATAMLRHCAELAHARGAHRIQLETDEDNWPARNLYEREGYQWISHKEVYMLPLRHWYAADI